jgi:hypothetical protein
MLWAPFVAGFRLRIPGRREAADAVDTLPINAAPGRLVSDGSD